MTQPSAESAHVHDVSCAFGNPTCPAFGEPEPRGIRRRCWWCAVTLRWWQMNSCRRCKRALVAPYVGPPCQSRSRWDAEPDAMRTRPGEEVRG